MDIECVICMENMKINEILKTTYCGHLFHENCINEWVKSSNSCPQCRLFCSRDQLREINFNFLSDRDVWKKRENELYVELFEKDTMIAKIESEYLEGLDKKAQIEKEIAELDIKLKAVIAKVDEKLPLYETTGVELSKEQAKKKELELTITKCRDTITNKDKIINELKLKLE